MGRSPRQLWHVLSGGWLQVWAIMNKRHELQQNELAFWLEEKIEDIRPYFPVIGIGTLAALLVVIGVWWYSAQQAQASAASWNAYFSAIGERNQQEALQKVIEDEKTSEPANWARQTLADSNLALGAAAVFTDREESKKRLEAAVALYSEILKYTNDPLLQVRAGFGLARAKESLFEPEEAKKLYEEVAKSSPDTVIGQEAKAAAERLSKPEELQMLEWLAQQTPKRPAPLSSGRPGSIPGLPSDLPDRPDIGLPGLDGLGLPGAGAASGGLSFPTPDDAPKSDAPASDAPASDEAPKTDAPAADDAPKADAPAEGKGAEAAPPADAPPAEAPSAEADQAPPSEAPAEESAPPADDSK
jgi:tetratricopeptide (TPR) repeat protein